MQYLKKEMTIDLLNNDLFSQKWHAYQIWIWYEVERNCELVRWQNLE